MDNENTSQQADLFHDYVEHKRASTGQRFVNFIVDNLFMSFGLSQFTERLAGFIIGQFFPDFGLRQVTSEGFERDMTDIFLLSYAVGIFNYLFYYTICEKAFKGYTLGKLISGTRAIREDGNELSFKDALLRSLCRLVPFEVFSGFATPWHDSWTNTTVIQAR